MSRKRHSFVLKDRSGKIHQPRGTRQRTPKSARSAGKGNRPVKSPPGKAKATVDKNRKGFGFLIFEDRKREDVFVPPRQAESLFHGDRVEVTLDGRGRAIDIKVLQHRFRELIGRYVPNPSSRSGKGGWVVYERKRAREEVYAPQGFGEAKAGDWVRAKLHFHDTGLFPVTAEIQESFGEILPPTVDVAMIAAEYSLDEEHSAAAENEARQLRLETDLPERTDLSSVPFITIDGETARDFDDAVYVERVKSGYRLWVAIADVSHYVIPGSALDREARSRGTSVYFPERAFHMLPRALSEGLCSLKPHEPRLAMVARMDFDRNGKRTRTDLLEAVIRSHRRATYTEIQKEWEQHGKKSDWEYHAHFSLYEKIRTSRSERGSIDFDLPEAEVLVDATGEPISITHRPRLDAHRLIEEFMIAANEAVTDWIMARKWPFIYRTHDEPAEQALLKFQKLAATVGVRVSVSDEDLQETLAELVRRVEGHPAQALLNTALLRSMKQAIYSSTHGIHFGLASPGYTHFTSPIRRYPDLEVHRILRRALRAENRKPRKQELDQLEKDLAETCEHCSYRERIAADAERESIKLKQVRAMLPQLGNEFDAKIVGMADAGLFVQIDNPYVEGLVPKDTLSDDYYEFNEDRMIFYGKRKRRTFRIGDRLNVRAVRADLDRREIDFAAIEPAAR